MALNPQFFYPSTSLLRRDGLRQSQRLQPALDPAYARLDERSEAELLAFAAAYAKQLQFYPAEAAAPDPQVWAQLVPSLDATALSAAQQRADNPPHFALFLAFLKLFGLAQEQLNAFTKRHLDYYYREVLRLQPRPAVADQVHLTMELARGVAELVVPAGTTFDAGVDATEQPLLYRTVADQLLNRASLAHLRATYTKLDGYTHPNNDGAVYFAPAVNTADGVAAALPADSPSWSGFEPPQPTGAGLAWPVAQVGFALAAPILRLAGGERTISVNLRSYTKEQYVADPGIPIRVQLSGPAGWLELPATHPDVYLSVDEWFMGFTIVLPPEMPPVVDYNPAVHDGGYVTEAPVLRVLLPPGSYEKVRDIEVDTVRMQVVVEGLRQGVELSNDYGRLPSDKPFQPFGPAPEPGTGFYIDCPEAAAKALTSVSAGVTSWPGIPNFDQHYANYNGASPRWAAFVKKDNYYLNKFKSYLTYDIPVNVVINNYNLKAANHSWALFKKDDVSESTLGLWYASEEQPGIKEFSPVPNAPLALAVSTNTSYGISHQQGNSLVPATAQLQLPNRPTPRPAGEHLLAVYLGRDFGHSQYPTLLVTAAATDGTGQSIPNVPYTPLAESLLFGYSASTDEVELSGSNGSSAAKFSQRSVQLLHQGPFGWAEEHGHLRQPLSFLGDARNSVRLVTPVTSGGTLLVGLRDAVPNTTVPVLFQLAASSANADRPAVEVRWSVLSYNQWRPLNGVYTPDDHTDSLRVSGIVEFTLPPETTSDNTLLDKGFVWLRAELFTIPTAPATAQPAPPDSVARLLGVHPQAVRAIFNDGGNDPAHYAQALPAGTIARVQHAPAGLKAVVQPYASFRGQGQETDAAFYRRVSERLRHKQRAVSVWDYEHLVLEQFPDLLQVRCLPHTRLDPRTAPAAIPKLLELVPGWVTLVVLAGPQTATDQLQLMPKADAATLAAITRFLQERSGPQVKIQVVNPLYDTVQVLAKVAFRPGRSFALNQETLNQALRGFLSPWGVQDNNAPNRSRQLLASSVLAFIEAQPYVDYVTEVKLRFKMATGGAYTTSSSVLKASSEMSLLTSALAHDFTQAV
jgi:hypothetical protein